MRDLACAMPQRLRSREREPLMFPRTDDLLARAAGIDLVRLRHVRHAAATVRSQPALLYRAGAGGRDWRNWRGISRPAPLPGAGFFGLVQSDVFSFFFRLLVGMVAVLVILAADSYLERENLPHAEFYALVLFATAGMGVLASARELLTAFIGLEMSSISSYILAGFRRDSMKSSEASLKYFLLGSFATAFFLYGIALVYGATGTTNLSRMDDADPEQQLC